MDSLSSSKPHKENIFIIKVAEFFGVSSKPSQKSQPNQPQLQLPPDEGGGIFPGGAVGGGNLQQNLSEDRIQIVRSDSPISSQSESDASTEICQSKVGSNEILTTSSQSDPEKSSHIVNKSGWRKYGGLLFTLIASFSFSLAILFVKKLQKYGFQSFCCTFWRYLGIFLPSIPVLIYCQFCRGRKSDGSGHPSVFEPIWPLRGWEKWKTFIALLGRGFFGASGVILRYYALEYISIGDTSVITYSSPVLVTVLAHFFLGEKCGVVSILTTILALFGVMIIARPPLLTGAEDFDMKTLIGTGLALGSLVCGSLIVIITRKIRQVHFSLMTLVFGSIGLVQGLILSLSFNVLKVPQGVDDILLIIGLIVMSSIGQMAIIFALKFEQAGPVALLRSCDVIFGFLFEFIFIGLIPDVFSSIGASIILFGVIITGLRKWVSVLPDESRNRERFGFLLR